MKVVLIVCAGFFFVASCSAPESVSMEEKSDVIRVELDSFYDDPGRGFFIFYPMSEMEDSIRNQTLFPDLSQISDTAFGQIYFSGTNQGAIEKGILVLIGDHNSESPSLWVDYDNDLNFVETSEPLKFSGDFVDISISNMDAPQLSHTVRLHKPDSTEKSAMKAAIEQFILGGDPYTDFYLDQRRNIVVGDFVYKEDSVRIGLMDWDVNGAYNDFSVDRIVVGEYGGKIGGTEESEGALIIDSVNYIQGDLHCFEVVEISDNGFFISIKPSEASNLKDKIVAGELMPDFTFELSTGQKTSIHQHLEQGKYLYLNFWANWCSGCHQEVEYLKKIHTDFADKFTLISLNYNEDSDAVELFLEKYNIDWLNGFSTQEINEALFIEGLPRSILIHNSGNIVEMDIHPMDLLDRVGEF